MRFRPLLLILGMAVLAASAPLLAQTTGSVSGVVRDSNGAPLPVTEMVDAFYADVEAMGGKRWDTSSLFAPEEKPRRSKS